MNDFFQNLLQSGVPEILVQSLLHSLWQSLLIGLILFLLLKNIPTTKSALRYKAGLTALLCTLLCWLGTLSILTRDAPVSQNTHTIESPPLSSPVAHMAPSEIERQPPTASPSILTVDSLQDTPRKESVSMHTLLATSWSIGVCLMILRLCIALTGSRRHRNLAIPIDDSALTKRLDELCQLFSIHRTIVFAVSHTLKHPGVIGAIKPIVLIPASMLTGFSPSDIEAVVAHELAHIRRHDYLFNLLQMVIESLFFFNPAVWWISHRIRLERESCCDNMAMEATGQKYEYANLLLNEFGGPQATAMAFSSKRKADAKERLLRIVQPHHKIDTRISILRLSLILGITGAAIVTLAKTSDLAVETVANILTPKERVEQLIQIANESDQSSDNEDSYSKIPISGTVKTYDGAPFSKWSDAHIASFSKNRSIHLSAKIKNDGRFLEMAPPDLCKDMIIYADAKGYAPAFSEIIELTESGLSETPELILEAGFPLTMNIVSESGAPVSHANIHMVYMHRDEKHHVYLQQQSITGNVNGTAIVEHATEYSVRISIKADGYQPIDNLDLEIKNGQPLTFTMKKGLIATGTVVSSETGAPIPDARFLLTQREKNGQRWSSGQGMDAGKTDAQGRFTFNTLNNDTSYSYTLNAEGYNRIRLENIDAANFPEQIELEPERSIRGTVIGDLKKIKSVFTHEGGHQRKYAKGLRYTAFKLKDGQPDHQSLDQGIVKVIIEDGIGHFELKDYLGDLITLYSSGNQPRAIIRINGQPVEDLVINMDSDVITRNTPHQVVTLKFNSPEGLPLAEGEVNVRYRTKEQQDQGHSSWTNMKVLVKKGIGKASFPAPCYINLEGDHQLAGYWIDDNEDEKNNWQLIEINDRQPELNYSLNPAGGITGKITNHLGQPLNGMNMRIRPVYPKWNSDQTKLTSESSELRMQQYEKARAIENIIRTHNNRSRNGKFAFTSLPLGHTYIVTALSKNTWLVSDPITVSLEDPIPQITLTHPQLQKTSVQVLMPDGSPASELPIHFKVIINTASHGYGGQRTDKNGYYEFTELNPDPRLKYQLSIEAGDEWQPIQATVEAGSDLSYTLKKGLQLKGRVLDDATGKPLEGLTVAVADMATIELSPPRSSYTTTDSDGAFILSKLTSGEHAIGVMGMEIISPEKTDGRFNIVTAGEKDFIELRVKPVENPAEL